MHPVDASAGTALGVVVLWATISGAWALVRGWLRRRNTLRLWCRCGAATRISGGRSEERDRLAKGWTSAHFLPQFGKANHEVTDNPKVARQFATQRQGT